jgi:hypothetical protein
VALVAYVLRLGAIGFGGPVATVPTVVNGGDDLFGEDGNGLVLLVGGAPGVRPFAGGDLDAPLPTLREVLRGGGQGLGPRGRTQPLHRGARGGRPAPRDLLFSAAG